MELNKLILWFEKNIGIGKSFSGKKLKRLLTENQEINTNFLLFTKEFPETLPLCIRYRLFMKKQLIFPKCINCQQKFVSWNKTNLKILQYCSKTCASSDAKTREKVKNTFLTNYGVSHIMQLKEFKENYKLVCLNKYGVDNVSKSEFFKIKKEQTNIKNWGVKNVSQHPEIKNKSAKSALSNSFLKYRYKNTQLTYCGSYELYFLELMEKENLINFINRGPKFEYFLNDKSHNYFIDFKVGDLLLEIKSTWTYDKNGTDYELREKNQEKWKQVRASGLKLKVLFNKKQILSFVNKIKKGLAN